MYRILFINTLVFIISAICSPGYSANSNIIIQDLLLEYSIKETNGQMTQVKCSETITFLAQRTDDRAYAATSYTEDIKVDKASAPGAKPVYMQNDDDDVFFSGQRICVLPIDLKVNKPTKASFQRTFLKPEQFSTVPLISNYEIKHSRTLIHVPTALAQRIKITPLNLTANMTFTRQETANEVIYTLKAENVPFYNHEMYAPHTSLCAPRLKVTGYFSDVNDLYRYLNSRIKLDNAAHASVDSLAQRLTQNKPTVIEKIDTIASWVRQNIRYIAIENGDYGIYPEEPENVLHKRYGDCKGSAGLIRSMLRSVGIDGRFVWVGTRDDIDFDWTDFPALGSGNHMTAAAVVNDSIIYLDGTVRYCPAGYIPISIRGAQTIIEKDANECIISRVPDVSTTEDTDSLHATINITDNGVSGHLHRCLKGLMHNFFCQSYYDNKKQKQSDILKTILAYPKNATTTFSNIELHTGADNNPNGTVIEADFNETASISRTASALYVSVYPIKESFLDVIDTTDRVRGLRIAAPHRYVANIEINIPDGYTPDAIPMQRNIISKWFDCDISYTLSDNGKAVICNAVFSTAERIAERTELDQWNSDFKKFMSANQWRLVFQKNN